MKDWNVVVTLLPDGYRDAMRILPRFGRVARTDFWDVLVMRVEQTPRAFLEALRQELAHDATLANAVARLIPVMQTFCYQSAQAFRDKAQDAVGVWAPDLEGKTFYVRLHRRGFKGTLSSHVEEMALGNLLLARCAAAGKPAKVEFADPDMVIVVEMIGPRAGAACWGRAELARYELLRID